MDDKKKTGIGRDDDGNIDDKRVAGWISFLVAVIMGGMDILDLFEANSDIVNSLLIFSAACLMPTVLEKLWRNNPIEKASKGL